MTAVLSAALRRRRPLAPPAPPGAAAGRYRLVLLTFAIFTVYVFLLPLLGYRVATVLFVGVLQATLDPPRAAAGVVRWWPARSDCMLVTYYVFEAYLNVLLPRGRLTGF